MRITQYSIFSIHSYANCRHWECLLDILAVALHLAAYLVSTERTCVAMENDLAQRLLRGDVYEVCVSLYYSRFHCRLQQTYVSNSYCDNHFRHCWLLSNLCHSSRHQPLLHLKPHIPRSNPTGILQHQTSHVIFPSNCSEKYFYFVSTVAGPRHPMFFARYAQCGAK